MSIRNRFVHVCCLGLATVVFAQVNAAPIVIDDFEQNNAKPNSLGLWSDLWVDTATSSGGLVPDTPGAQKNGLNGGVLYYSNGVTEVSSCAFYTVLRTNAPFTDLSQGPWYVRFWVRANEGTPAIDQVRLEDNAAGHYGQVSFSNYNYGFSTLFSSWREISIPASNFLANAAGFSIASVARVSFTLATGSSTGRVSSLFVDDLILSTNPAPTPATLPPVTNTLMIDNFEQANGNANTVGYWSDVSAGGPGSTGGFLSDFSGAQKNGLRGGIAYYSNAVPEQAPGVFYTVLEQEWPYLDISRSNLFVRFWVKVNAGTPAIDQVILEGGFPKQQARVDFAPFNNGAHAVVPDWFEVSIPVTNFLADNAAFPLAHASALLLSFVSNSSPQAVSAICLDDIQVTTNKAPPAAPSIAVTNLLVIDNFEQNNQEPNTLGYWSGVYFDEAHGSYAGLIPDIGGAQWSGSRGGILFYSNGVSESAQCLFYTVLRTNAPWYDLAATGVYVRFWIKANEGTPAIDKVILKGRDDASLYGQVNFADYNGGTASLDFDWKEISIPATNFLGDVHGAFSLSKIGLLAFTFASNSSPHRFSSLFLDEVVIATNPAPAGTPDIAVTNLLVIDNFEQNNQEPNTLGYWSSVYFDPVGGSFAGLIPDIGGGAQWSGFNGGVLFYSNGISESAQCLFYSVLRTNTPWYNLAATGVYVRFWIRANEGTPAIDQVILQGRDASRYARVNFSSYNGGTRWLGTDWREISIPASDFLADVHGGFSLSKVGLLGFTLASNSSPNRFSSLFLDDIVIATNPAPVPAPDILVTNLLVIDDFEQNNQKPNTLGRWSDVYFDPAQSFAGLVPDFANVAHGGTLGGILFYSNSLAATVPCMFYSVLTETWPYADLSSTSLVVQFWIKSDTGAPVVNTLLLQGADAASLGQVNFADYNTGSSAAPAQWTHISVPVRDFLNSSSGGFSLSRVKLFALKFNPASSVGSFSSVFIDDLRVIDTRDTDSDGEPDAADPDDDNDALPDTWESAFFGGLTNAIPGDDGDGDGASNYGEYVADTHPGNSNSVFEIRILPLQSPLTISFDSSTGRLYDVQYSTNLVTGNWVNLDVNVHGNGHETDVPDLSPAAYRVYRIRVKLP